MAFGREWEAVAVLAYGDFQKVAHNAGLGQVGPIGGGQAMAVLKDQKPSESAIWMANYKHFLTILHAPFHRADGGEPGVLTQGAGDVFTPFCNLGCIGTATG